MWNFWNVDPRRILRFYLLAWNFAERALHIFLIQDCSLLGCHCVISNTTYSDDSKERITNNCFWPCRFLVYWDINHCSGQYNVPRLCEKYIALLSNSCKVQHPGRPEPPPPKTNLLISNLAPLFTFCFKAPSSCEKYRAPKEMWQENFIRERILKKVGNYVLEKILERVFNGINMYYLTLSWRKWEIPQ